jgi:serine/threonine-protein phosphatase PGAM5
VARTLLYLVRHGEHEHHGDDRDPGLTRLGEQQARLLGRRLADVPFDVVRHSPLRRAAQTAQIVAAQLHGVPVTSSELLRDRTPLPPDGEPDAVPPRYRPFLARTPPGEGDPGARHLNAAIGELTAVGAQDRCELLVTHNFVIGWLVRYALDAPWWRWIGLNQFNCGLTILEIHAGAPPMLISFNDVGHLPVDLRGHPPVALRS